MYLNYLSCLHILNVFSETDSITPYDMHFFSCLNTAAYFLAKIVNFFLYFCPNVFLILPKIPCRTENILICFFI